MKPLFSTVRNVSASGILISISFMTPFQVISSYHADDTLKVHNTKITTQFKIPFVFKHLASYTPDKIFNMRQKVLKTSNVSRPFCATQYMHMHSKLLPAYLFVCVRARRDALYCRCNSKKVSKEVN